MTSPEFHYIPLTSRRNRPYLRDPERYQIREPRAIVLHWDGNTGKGSDALANRNYFDRTDRYASAQFLTDHLRIVQSMPIREVAYHCGGTRYKHIGEQLREGYSSPNYTTWGIEMCTHESQEWEATYANTVEVAANLIVQSEGLLFVDDITTHHRITGKICPKWRNDDGRLRLITDDQLHAFRQAVELRFWELTTADLLPIV